MGIEDGRMVVFQTLRSGNNVSIFSQYIVYCFLTCAEGVMAGLMIVHRSVILASTFITVHNHLHVVTAGFLFA